MAYLEGYPNYNFQLYKQLVDEITNAFKKISLEIIDIRQQFENHGSAVGLIISNIQEQEELKLNNVSTMGARRNFSRGGRAKPRELTKITYFSARQRRERTFSRFFGVVDLM